ncbi:hypothetical protein QEN19_002056 [Hanseniaspora menglaensis]
MNTFEVQQHFASEDIVEQQHDGAQSINSKIVPAASKEVGKLYENIISQVLQDIKPLFEDHGVDEETLQELQKLWEKKLVDSKTVPKFSWQDDEDYDYEEDEQQEQNYNSENNDASNTKKEENELDKITTEDEIKRLEKIKKEQKNLKQTALLDNEEVNSDLDDSDDDYLNTDDDIEDNNNEENGNIILCQYEKVVRVKNKWKWVLKDGVVSCNGKDYCFKKATGESDW